ncbi:MAG TPA: hypothetical protein VFI47_01430, partial [Acidimicrobiales bacterium]|nr:hypothetical protein [Acidimicrobiales bacterium]
AVREPTPAGATAIGPTLADRTAVVPTVVARGWGVEALPARPPGGPSFWFAGEEHHDARSLAGALQSGWDDAVSQTFRRRDPVWLGELAAFLRARGLDEADRIVAAGSGDDPPAAAMARLLLALDAGLDPRVGPLWLTPDGLEAAARAVVDRGVGGERLAEVGAARLLRLWRSLPGMERAAAIDERWRAGTEAFGHLAAGVSPQAGWPSPVERQQASATLLLCAVHPDHERRLGRRLAAARRGPARRQSWWAALAAAGERDPAAAVLAVMTAPKARALDEDERRAAREAESRRPEPPRPSPPAHPPGRPPPPVHLPLTRALSGVRRTWVLVAMLGALVTYLWAMATFGDRLVEHYRIVAPDSDRIAAYESASAGAGLAVVLLLALPAVHVATRVVVRRGASRRAVRGYAGVAGLLDLLLGFALVQGASVGLLVVGVVLEGELRPGVPAPFRAEEPWLVAGLLVPLGLAGVALIVRSCWRLARVVFGRPVAGPPFVRAAGR